MKKFNTTAICIPSKHYKDMECEDYLGELRPEHEWLAFTFREQKINTEKYRKHFTRMMSGYENILRDAKDMKAKEICVVCKKV